MAVIVATIENESDGQKEGIESATLDRVPDDSSIESVELVVRYELARIVSLFYPPYDKTGNNEVGDERYGEQGGCDGFNFRSEGGLTRDKVGKLPDGDGDQRFFCSLVQNLFL